MTWFHRSYQPNYIFGPNRPNQIPRVIIPEGWLITLGSKREGDAYLEGFLVIDLTTLTVVAFTEIDTSAGALTLTQLLFHDGYLVADGQLEYSEVEELDLELDDDHLLTFPTVVTYRLESSGKLTLYKLALDLMDLDDCQEHQVTTMKMVQDTLHVAVVRRLNLGDYHSVLLKFPKETWLEPATNESSYLNLPLTNLTFTTLVEFEQHLFMISDTQWGSSWGGVTIWEVDMENFRLLPEAPHHFRHQLTGEARIHDRYFDPQRQVLLAAGHIAMGEYPEFLVNVGYVRVINLTDYLKSKELV